MTIKLPRPWAWVLIVSLALNLFIAGVAVSWWGFHGRTDRAAAWDTAPFFAVRSLGDEARPLARRVWRDHRDELKPRVERMRAARREAYGVLADESYTPEAFAAALGRLRADSVEVQAGLHGALVDLSRELTPEQRRKLARAMGRRRH